jgi:hypothetical protein
MKRVIAVAGVAMVFLCAASVVGAEPRDPVERSQRMDTDAIRDDVRINRLRIPEHPISAVQPTQPTQPTFSSKGKAKSKKGDGGGTAN